MNGEALTQWREVRGWTAQRLARELDLQPSTITRWERGERRMPGRWLELALESLERKEHLFHAAESA